MISINKHIKDLKPSATLAINQKVTKLRNGCREITHFGFGQSPFPIHKSIIESLKRNSDNNHYLPTLGLPELRREISIFLKNHQSIDTHSSQIYIGPGSKELLFQTIMILEGTFLIPQGSWVSYVPQIKSKGGDYSILDTFYEDNFKLTSKTFEAYCKKHPAIQKILILNSPNNPTGAVYTKEELRKLAQVCKKWSVIVLSDEIYSQVNFSDSTSPSMATVYPERTFVFGGLSKVFSAGGYRLGFMAIPQEMNYLEPTFQALFSETFSAVSSPIQYAAIEAFKMNDSIQNQIRTSTLILKGIALYIYNRCLELNIQCTAPQGSFYVVIGFSYYKEKINSLGIQTDEELAHHLLQEYEVALLPGSDFYFSSEEFLFRLAFVDFDGSKLLEMFNDNETIIDDSFVKKHLENIYSGISKIKSFIDSL